MKKMMKELLMGKLKIKKSSDATIIDWLSREEDNSYVLHIKWCTHSPLILVVGQFIGSSKLGNYELMTFLYSHILPMHVWPSDGQNVQICTRFPEIKCFFLSLRVRCVLRHFLVHQCSMPWHTVCVLSMCRRLSRHNFLLNRPPQDLVNVAVKLNIDSSFGR